MNEKEIDWNSPIKRGEVKRFKEHLNKQDKLTCSKHKNGPYHQIKRLYGDYLYSQDREKFMVDLRIWLHEGN